MNQKVGISLYNLMMLKPLKIAIAGPCVSGKTSLAGVLQSRGYDARAIAQEHSYVPYMWQRITKPDVLIYLDVSYGVAKARRPRITWGPERLVVQAERLAHARAHCDFYVDTDGVPAGVVAEKTLAFLASLMANG